jgi:hypothetical protein
MRAVVVVATLVAGAPAVAPARVFAAGELRITHSHAPPGAIAAARKSAQ